METPKRLTPRADVTRRLYLASGNRCAFPQCEEALMGSNAVLVGEIAHIEGALPDSKRFNAAMTNEQRRLFDNLILMCGTHHTVIDRNDTAWTVARLRELKRKHEAIYTVAVDKLRQQVGDITDGVTFTPATSGLAVLGDQRLEPNELEASRRDINAFGERLSRIPVDARSVLALIVERGEQVDGRHGNWSAEFQIPIRVLKSIADCNAAQLRQHTEVLEHFDLLQRDDEPFDGPPLYLVGNSTGGLGWPLLHEIRDLDAPDRPVVRRILCDLDFSAFDGA